MTQRNDEFAARTAVIVLAGGKGKRLAPLTRSICKPALPFGGSLCCIDFSLSNAVNSGLRRIAVATQYKPDALLAHLWNRWNCVAVGDAPVIRAWRAEERAERFGHCGTANAIYRNLASIRDLNHSLVLVLAGDHVYKMDYRPMLAAHLARNASMTVGCVEVPLADSQRLGCLTVAEHGRVERFIEKPHQLPDASSAGDKVLASMGIYVFDGAVLGALLATDAALSCSGHDFGTDIVPRVLASGSAYAYELRGSGQGGTAYWRDIGTLQSYWQTHMDLLGPTPLLTLDDPTWPIGRMAGGAQAIVGTTATSGGGTVCDSIVAARCNIAGQLRRSVLCHDVEVGHGTVVEDAVILPGAVVGAGGRLRGVIVDAGYRVPEGAVVERQAETQQPPVLSRHSGRTAHPAVT